MKVRRYIFTINNPTAEDDPRTWAPAKIKYMQWQLERGDNGTPHYQGFVIFNQSYDLAYLKRHFNSRAHWEHMRGKIQDNEEYTSKDEGRLDGPFTVGTRPAQGTRNDLAAVQQAIDAGASLGDIARDHFTSFIRYHKGFVKYIEMQRPPRPRDNIEVRVYYGPPGTGKTRRAFFEAQAECAEGEEPFFIENPNTFGGAIWFDGYEGQQNIIIDEFYGWISHAFMCRLLDRYPLRVQTKGGTLPFSGCRFWITSNAPPVEWWAKTGLGAIERRLNVVEYMGGPDVWEPPIPEIPQPELPLIVQQNCMQCGAALEGFEDTVGEFCQDCWSHSAQPQYREERTVDLDCHEVLEDSSDEEPNTEDEAFIDDSLVF